MIYPMRCTPYLYTLASTASYVEILTEGQNFHCVDNNCYKRLHLVGQWVKTGGGICEFKLFCILIKMLLNILFYYIKGSGILSGNKLIKTISFFENDFLPLELHLNLLVYDRSIFGCSSVAFDNLR